MLVQLSKPAQTVSRLAGRTMGQTSREQWAYSGRKGMVNIVCRSVFRCYYIIVLYISELLQHHVEPIIWWRWSHQGCHSDAIMLGQLSCNSPLCPSLKPHSKAPYTLDALISIFLQREVSTNLPVPQEPKPTLMGMQKSGGRFSH